MADIEGFKSLMKSVNEYGPNIRQDTLDGRIDNEWDDLVVALERLNKAESTMRPPERSLSEKVDELLRVVRDFDKVLTVPVISRYKGQTFLTKAYRVVRGRSAILDFRSVNEHLDVLDSSTPLSELEKKAIQHYYGAEFGAGVKSLMIIDPAWKGQFITSPGGPLEQQLQLSDGETPVID